MRLCCPSRGTFAVLMRGYRLMLSLVAVWTRCALFILNIATFEASSRSNLQLVEQPGQCNGLAHESRLTIGLLGDRRALACSLQSALCGRLLLALILVRRYEGRRMRIAIRCFQPISSRRVTYFDSSLASFPLDRQPRHYTSARYTIEQHGQRSRR